MKERRRRRRGSLAAAAAAVAADQIRSCGPADRRTDSRTRLWNAGAATNAQTNYRACPVRRGVARATPVADWRCLSQCIRSAAVVVAVAVVLLLLLLSLLLAICQQTPQWQSMRKQPRSGTAATRLLNGYWKSMRNGRRRSAENSRLAFRSASVGGAFARLSLHRSA